MAGNDLLERPLSGEERLKRRRKSFWRYFTLGFIAASIANCGNFDADYIYSQ